MAQKSFMSSYVLGGAYDNDVTSHAPKLHGKIRLKHPIKDFLVLMSTVVDVRCVKVKELLQ